MYGAGGEVRVVEYGWFVGAGCVVGEERDGPEVDDAVHAAG